MTELFKVVILLVRLSKNIAHSSTLVAIIIITGLISGVSYTLLIATINSTLNNAGKPRATLVLTFAALCLAVASLRFVSGAVLVHLMKKVMMSLRLDLSRKILNAPLRLLENMVLTDCLRCSPVMYQVLPMHTFFCRCYV